ncbi:MAG: MBL fold metallo-hydrolase, partial [Pseudomonadota bacterium]
MDKLSIGIVPVTPFEQNCTLIWNEENKSGVVIDPGGDVPRIQQALDQTGITMEKILRTHGHLDQVGGARALMEAVGVEVVG